jgi:REP element-mobilizing transposase RayT
MEFTDPRTTPFVPLKWRGELPHLYKPGACYFVTFRLADAVIYRSHGGSQSPDEAFNDPRDLLRDYDPPITLGECHLRDPRIAALVQEAILHFNEQRYQLVSWCVMPNHVHGILAPLPQYPLHGVLQSWKGYTAREANRILGRFGPFWERESFDHVIRTADAVERFARYIDENPVVAGLCAHAADWPYGSAGTKFPSPLGQR